jgi:hypothetical protein
MNRNIYTPFSANNPVAGTMKDENGSFSHKNLPAGYTA